MEGTKSHVTSDSFLVSHATKQSRASSPARRETHGHVEVTKSNVTSDSFLVSHATNVPKRVAPWHETSAASHSGKHSAAAPAANSGAASEAPAPSVETAEKSPSTV